MIFRTRGYDYDSAPPLFAFILSFIGILLALILTKFVYANHSIGNNAFLFSIFSLCFACFFFGKGVALRDYAKDLEEHQKKIEEILKNL